MRGSTGAAAPLAPLTVTDFSAVRQRPAHASGKNTGFFCCLPTSGTCVRKEYRIQVSAHRKDFPFRRILYTITPYTEKPRPAFTGRDCVVLFSFRLSGLRSRQTLFRLHAELHQRQPCTSAPDRQSGACLWSNYTICTRPLQEKHHLLITNCLRSVSGFL